MERQRWVKTCVVLIILGATPIASFPQTFTTLYVFNGTDGDVPGLGGLVQGTDGNLYGVTSAGGPSPLAGGDGTIFKIAPSGSLTTIYDFCLRGDCPDGAHPAGGLVLSTGGNFYGTAAQGGIYKHGGGGGSGTIFRVTPAGDLTTLYAFCAEQCTDGKKPMGALVQGTGGNVYGITNSGGANHAGTVFRITRHGELTTLYSFCSQSNCTDGSGPMFGSIQAMDGNFYGTTEYGGASNWGTLFKITPNGSLTTLHSFAGGVEGATPRYLMQGPGGSFYGTTPSTIFQMAPQGAVTTIYTFCDQFNCSNGASPGMLVPGSDGDLYGVALEGGFRDYGTVFKITSSGNRFVTLHKFTGGTDGALPVSLLQATDGSFYGTTEYNYGTVFRLSVGLGPFVKTVPVAGTVGTAVTILGTDLTGATGVTFGGTAAPFTIVSPTEITATVPAGAETGKVQVVTPGGTLSSNVAFRVTP
jgi:uncharacterized repeat protein (TIGR03803 family)